MSQDREAERKREDFYARVDPGVTGETARKNTCDVLRTPPLTPDWDAQKKAAVRTAKSDVPIKSDPLGNAIVGGLAAGVIGGVGAAGINGSISALGKVGIKDAAESVSKDLAWEGVRELARRSGGPGDMVTRPASPAPEPATAAPPEVGGGKSSSRAACEDARTPNASHAPVVPDRAPYAPGKAPAEPAPAFSMIRG